MTTGSYNSRHFLPDLLVTNRSHISAWKELELDCFSHLIESGVRGGKDGFLYLYVPALREKSSPWLGDSGPQQKRLVLFI